MRPKWKINSMPPQKPHAWNKVSNIQCKLFSSAKEKPRNKSLYGKKNPYTRILSRTKVPKKLKCYGWTHPCGSLNFKGSVFHPWEKSVFKQLLNHYYLAIQNCHLLRKWYSSCDLCLKSAAEISRCHVCAKHVRRKWYYWLFSLSLWFPS